MARRSRWRRLRRSVASVSAPPAPKFQASSGRRWRAARRISGSVTKRGASDGWVMASYYTPGGSSMELGCHLPTTQPPATAREALLTFAREAEKREIASLWVSDHVVIPRVTTGYGRG